MVAVMGPPQIAFIKSSAERSADALSKIRLWKMKIRRDEKNPGELDAANC
jgi:hypothetical protein